MDALLRIDIRHAALLHFLKTLKRCNTLAAVNLVSSKTVNIKCKKIKD